MLGLRPFRNAFHSRNLSLPVCLVKVFFSSTQSPIKWSNYKDISEIILERNPTIDPRTLKISKLKSLCQEINKSEISEPNTKDLERIMSEWKLKYENQLHESAFDEVANPGELCDGELPSWTRDRKRVEQDKDAKVSTVSGHEAATRLDAKAVDKLIADNKKNK